MEPDILTRPDRRALADTITPELASSHRSVGQRPLWVINGTTAFEIRLLFYPQERTFRNHHLCERPLCATSGRS
jgi:hypothetical protein